MELGGDGAVGRHGEALVCLGDEDAEQEDGQSGVDTCCFWLVILVVTIVVSVLCVYVVLIGSSDFDTMIL